MTRLGYVGGKIYRTNIGDVSRLTPCPTDIFIGECSNCSDPVPSTYNVTLQPIAQAEVHDGNCNSCESLPGTYTLLPVRNEQNDLCDGRLYFCQCANNFTNQQFPSNLITSIGSVFLSIKKSGNDIHLNVTFFLAGQGSAVFSKIFYDTETISCSSLNEVLTHTFSSNACTNLHLFEVVVQSPGNEYEEHAVDCPYCEWDTDPGEFFEFRFVTQLEPPLPPAIPSCECRFPDEWIPLRKVENRFCCIWESSPIYGFPLGYCIESVRLVINEAGYFLLLSGDTGFGTLAYNFDIGEPHDCSQTYTLSFAGGVTTTCENFEDVTIQVRPLRSSSLFKSYESNFSAFSNFISSLSQEHKSFEQSIQAQVKVSGDFSQIHSDYTQTYSGQIKIIGNLSSEFSSYEQSHTSNALLEGSFSSEHSSYNQQHSSVTVIPGSLSTQHTSYEQELSGTITPVSTGSLSSEHSSYEQNLEGTITPVSTGSLASEHSSYEQSILGKVSVEGTISQEHKSYEQSEVAFTRIEGNISQEHKSYEQSFEGYPRSSGSIELTHNSYEQNFVAKAILEASFSQVHSTYEQAYLGSVKISGMLAQSWETYEQQWIGKFKSEGSLSQNWETYEQQWNGNVFTPDPCNVNICIYECQGAGAGWTLIVDCESLDCNCPPAPPSNQCVEGENEGEQRQFNCNT